MQRFLRRAAALLAAILVICASISPRPTAAQPTGYRCDGSTGVYFYTGLNHSGRCLRLSSHVGDLSSFGFDDAVSSIRMDGVWTVVLYADANFSGASTIFSGDDPNLIDNAVGDNRASSVRVWPGVVPSDQLCDGQEGVYLYDLPGYGGRCLRFAATMADLGTSGVNNTISSISFVGIWTATLYADRNFAGDASTFIANDSDLADNRIGRDRASALRVQRGRYTSALSCDGGAGVYLYERAQYQGLCQRFINDVADLRSYAFDDTAASLYLVGDWAVTLYRDPGYTGVSAEIARDMPDLAMSAVGAGQATSLQIRRAAPSSEIACDGRPGVYLYQDPQYLGRCLRFTADTPDLRPYGFDDLASAVRLVGGYSAMLFREPDFTGVSSDIRDDDPDLADNAVGDNQATSLRVREPSAASPVACDDGPGIYVYADDSYLGRCIKLTTNAPDLRIYGFDDQASSIRVVGDYTATLYRDLRFTGLASSVEGNNASLADDPIGDNQATSIQVRQGDLPDTIACVGEGVYLYQDPQYQGRCRKFVGDIPDLRVFDFNDIASSIRIVGPYSARLHADLAFRGAWSEFRSDAPDLTDSVVGDNQATSLQVLRR
ncbi:hypothetical protein EKD04_025340 [Chloroflexales bacterium ZM16-3]|nr:hypothetical protein [Chloroflexales bacterium ZM16-3]